MTPAEFIFMAFGFFILVAAVVYTSSQPPDGSA